MIAALDEKVSRLLNEKAVDNSLGQYLTRKEAAKAANVSPSTISNWARQGLLEKYGTGRNVRYKLGEIKAILDGEVY